MSGTAQTEHVPAKNFGATQVNVSPKPTSVMASDTVQAEKTKASKCAITSHAPRENLGAGPTKSAGTTVIAATKGKTAQMERTNYTAKLNLAKRPIFAALDRVLVWRASSGVMARSAGKTVG